MAFANNLNQAQLLLELINDARLNPMANAARYITSYAPLQSSNANIESNGSFKMVNGATLQAQFQALVPVEPLAWNDILAGTATAHSNLMYDNNAQLHVVAGEDDIGTRIDKAGYKPVSGQWLWERESIYTKGKDAMDVHAAFMVDWSGNPANGGIQTPAGHRDSLMMKTSAPAGSPYLREIGIGVIETPLKSNAGPLVVTEDFGGRSTSGVFLLGVAYNDNDRNNFYSLGEGLGGLNVSVGGTSASSNSAGGYTLSTTLTGTQTITYTGAGLSAPVTVTANLVDGHNYKIDVIDGRVLHTSVSATVSGPVTEIDGLGLTGLTLTAGAGAQTINGTPGGDTLTGGGGNDTINGAGGTDTAAFSGSLSNYAVRLLSATSVELRDTRAGSPDGTDIINNVEQFRFADGTVNFSDLRNTTTPVAGSVSITDFTIDEGNSGVRTANFVVTRTGGTAAFDLSFTTANGTATTADGDYVARTDSLHFNEGVASQTISIVINGDTKFESSETFLVNLTGATNGAAIVDGQAVGTITNDDAAPVAGSVAISDFRIDEGNSGVRTASFVVTRTGGTAAFDVGFATANGTATTADGDYVARTDTLHFNEGVGSQTISIAINGDTKFEGSETFLVNLTGATNGATISDGQAVGTITNDDAAPVIRRVADDYNHDGFSDILVQSDQSGQLFYAKMSQGSFSGWQTATGPMSGWTVGGHGDVNGDTFADIVLQNATTGQIRVAAQNGTATPTFVDVATLNAGWAVRGVADINGDRFADIIVQNDSTGQIFYADMANGRFTEWDSVTTQKGWKVVGAGDINHDGFADIVIQNTTSGATFYGNMQNGALAGWVNIGSLQGWQIGGVADFNGDGFADVLVQKTTGTNQMFYADMQNGQNAGWVAASDAISSDWQVHGVGDINGDGFADITVQQQSTSQISSFVQHAVGFDHLSPIVNPGLQWHEV